MSHGLAPGRSMRPAAHLAGHDLTPRQEEILAHVAEGFQNKEIAYRLGISEATVKAHISKTIQQTGCRNRVGLALLWLRRTGRLAS